VGRLPADFQVEGRRPRLTDAGPVGAFGRVSAETTVFDRLVERGLMGAGPDGARRVHPALAADLAVLTAPELLVTTRAVLRPGGSGLRAAHAVTGSSGVGLLRAAAGAGVEWSRFPGGSLGAELVRAVSALGVSAADDGRGPVPRRPAGVVPLAALVELPIAAQWAGGPVVEEIAADLGVTPAQRELAVRLAAQAIGVLEVTVAVGGGRGPELGRLTWLPTRGGWVGLAPEPTAGPGRPVRLVPVDVDRLGGWLAPLVGQALVEAAR
jgi:hypothetical protein